MTQRHRAQAQLSRKNLKGSSSNLRLRTLRSLTVAKLRIEEDWHPVRKCIGHCISSKRTNILVGLATLLNLCMVIVETDRRASKESVPIALDVITSLTLLLFTCESVCRVYVFREKMMFHPFYALDAVVSLVDVSVTVFASSSVVPMLCVLRCWRLFRAIKILLKMDQFRELYLMLVGLHGACRAVIWAAAIIGATILICSVLAVQIVHPLNETISESGQYADCERCPRAFASVWNSALTLIQQIITGDSWGLLTLPIIEAYPLSALFFFPVFLMIDLAVMNLVLMVVVDQAEAAREHDYETLLHDKEKEMEESKVLLASMCEQMDVDKNGSLTLGEMLKGAESNEEFRLTLKLMDISQTDLEAVFMILDEDESGTVEYKEFCDQLHKMKTDDSHTMLVLCRHQLKEVVLDVKKQLEFHRKQMQMQETSIKHLSQLSEEFMHKYDAQERSLQNITMLLQNRGTQAPGLGVPEAESPSLLQADHSSTILHSMKAAESNDRPLLDMDHMSLELSRLTALISQELSPIIRDDLVPVLRNVKLKMEAEWGPAIAGTAGTSSCSNSSSSFCAFPTSGSKDKAACLPSANMQKVLESSEFHEAPCEWEECCENSPDSDSQLSNVQSTLLGMERPKALLEMDAAYVHPAMNEPSQLRDAAPDIDDQMSVAETYCTAKGNA